MTTITQKIREHFRRHPTRTRDSGRRITVQERLPTRDTIVKAEPLEQNPSMHGLHWVGDLEPVGRALRSMTNVALRDRLTKAIVDAVANYPAAKLGHEDDTDDVDATDELTGGSMSRGPAGSYSTAGTRELGTAMTPAAMQDANRRYWDKVGNRYLAGARDSAAAISAPGSIRAVQLANEKFYSRPPVTTKRWGQP